MEGDHVAKMSLPKLIYITNNATLTSPPDSKYEPYVVVKPDTQTGHMVIKQVTPIVGEAASSPDGIRSINKMSHALGRLKTIAPTLSNIYTLHLSQPRNLLPVRVASKPASSIWMSEKEVKQIRRCFPGSPIVDSILPAEKSTLFTGWFLPDGDPSRIGTPYLCPAFRESDYAAGWTVRFVGLGKPPEGLGGYRFAAWNKPNLVRDLVDFCRACDIDYVETMALLDSPEGYEASANLLALQQCYLSARAAFSRPRDAIKPILVQDLVLRCARKNGFRPSRINDINLLPSSWSVLPEGTKPIYAGLSFAFHFDAHKAAQSEAIDSVLQDIRAGLSERNLGQLYLDSDGQHWIIKNHDLFLAHKKACGVAEDFTFIEEIL
jgi:hypothetical protein